MTAPESPAHHPFPWAHIGAIVLVVAFVIAGIWIVIRQFADGDLSDDPPPTTAISPEASPPGTPPPATPPGEATPGAVDDPAWTVGSLPHMLGLAPDRLSDDSLPLNHVASYADIAGWMAACGIAAPQSLDDSDLAGWEAQLDNLVIPSTLRDRGLDPVWRQTYGFDLTQVDQVVIVGHAPDYLTIMRGSFDADELQTAWVASGYQAVEVDEQTVWSLSPGDTIDLSAQESRPALGTMNNVVMLDDGTLIAAARMSRLGSALEVVFGNAPSLAENDDLDALLVPDSGVETLASAVISKGSLVQGTESTMPLPVSTPLPLPRADPAATPESEPGMPQVNVLLIGIPLNNAVNEATPTPQPKGPAAIVINVVFDEVEEARRAGVEIAHRLDVAISPVTGQPYRDRLVQATTSVIDSENRGVVAVDAALLDGSTDWLALLSDRDFGFLFWLPEE